MAKSVLSTIKILINKINTKRVFLISFFVIFCWLSARFILRGIGDPVNIGKYTVLGLLFIFLCSSKKTFWGIAFPIGFFAFLYSPFATIYGQPDFQSLISVFNTTREESLEFLSLIPLKTYLQAPFCLIFIFLAYYLATKLSLHPYKNKTIVFISLITLALFTHPTNFFDNLTAGIKVTQKELNDLDKLIGKSSWGKSSLAPQKYKDYILVIGESARRDYFQVYGYPVKDTPFLASSPATIVKGLTSGDTYTIGSLRLMLTQANIQTWAPRYDRNIIDLAKSANMDTIWLSNQGFEGDSHSPISAIATRAHIVKFASKGISDTTNFSDYRLLSQLQEVLNKPTTESRFIVLHTMGSHPNVCKRIYDIPDPYQAKDKNYQYIACYLTSIKKTDHFLELLVTQMHQYQAATNRKFSIIYFSDHGLTHTTKSNHETVLIHYPISYFQYNVPLIKIDSDEIDHRVIESRKSALHFTEGLATWMGIKNPNLQPYNLFDGISDSTDYGLNERRAKRNPINDPPIDMSDKLK